MTRDTLDYWPPAGSGVSYIEDEPECSHIWRPYWASGHIDHYCCDKCGEYREEDD